MSKLQLSVRQTYFQTVHSLSGNNSFNKSTGPYSKTEVVFSLGANDGPVGSLRCSQ